MKLSNNIRPFMAAAIVAAAAASCSTEKDSAPAPGSGEASGGVPAASAAIRGETIVSGNPSAADATTTISGKQLPPPDPKFGGVIKDNALQSKAWWAPRVVPPKRRPNVLLIMTDDVGFGAPSTFGGVIPTPALDRIAKNGLRYTQFHSTALCSPTRAALITGRNHHSAGFGVVSEQSTGFPGYNSIIPKDKATIGRILKDNGFATSWFGKDHNTPTFTASQVGPFDQWPIGMGFEYFYGFVGGDTSQWEPNLFRNTTPIYPYVGKPGLEPDHRPGRRRHRLAEPAQPDRSRASRSSATTCPAARTPRTIRRRNGSRRSATCTCSTRAGTSSATRSSPTRSGWASFPQDAKMTPWPDKTAEGVGPAHRRREEDVHPPGGRLCRLLAYTDHEIGRVIQAVEDMGKLDNTLIIYISGDNGSSAEGTLIGTPNEVAMFNGVQVPVEDQLKYFYDVWGTDRTYNHMAVRWTWAFDTPF